MDQIAPATGRPSEQPSVNRLKIVHWICFGLFVAVLGLVVLKTVEPIRRPETIHWPEAALVLLTATTTLISLSRQLPGQNVLLAAAVVALIGGGAQAIGAATAIPFGPYFYTEAAGPRLFGLLPCPVPLIWIIVILNARGVGRLMLRPWRKTRVYGFRLIGVTAALALIFDFGLEPFAVRVNDYWLWQRMKFPWDWYGAPVTNFVGWVVTALLILAFATPLLINKKPAKSPPPDYHPLIVWLLLNLLFVTAAFTHQLWLAAGFSAVAGIIVAAFAIRGARW